MYQKILLSCLLLGTLLTSCQKDTPSGVIVDIEDDFYIDLFEDLSTGTPNFQLALSTIKEQDCLNYSIDVSLESDREERGFQLTINDLVEPENCIEGMATTHLRIPIADSLESNLYTFNISLKEAIINEGTLRVTNNRYELSMDTDDGIEVVNTLLYKVPQNTVWGYIAYENDSAAGSAAAFIASVDALSSTFSIQSNPDYNIGYYGHFTLDNELDITLNNVDRLPTTNLISFIFRHNSDDLQDITEQIDIACEGNDNLEIALFSETGWTYTCN